MGEAKEVIPVGMGLVLAFIVARVPDTRWRASIIAVASVVLGFLATIINGEGLVHILFDTPQVALAAVVGLMLLGKYRPTWVRSESAATKSDSQRG